MEASCDTSFDSYIKSNNKACCFQSIQLHIDTRDFATNWVAKQ